MPRDGSGNYTLSGTPLVDGAIAEATGAPTAMQPKLDDLATALTGSVARNGEGPATANWPMAGFKLTGLAAGSSNGDSVRFEQVQPIDATLTAMAGVTTAADQIIYFTGVDVAAATTLTAFGRSLIDDANAAAALTTLGAVSLTASETVTGAKTWTQTQAMNGAIGWTITNSTPSFRMIETDAPAEETTWGVNLGGGNLLLSTFTDAGALTNVAMNIQRTGTTIDELELNATLFDFNGALDLSGNATIGGTIELGAASDTTLSRVSAGVVAIEGVNIVTVSASQTLTNKIINLGSNTLNGSTAQFNTALNDGDFATLAGSETLTNKTLTSPTINTPTINTPTINGGTESTRLQRSSETTGTLTVASANKVVACTGGITLDDGAFTADDAIMFDPGTSNRTFTRAAGATMYVNGVDSASATLAANQMGSAYWRTNAIVVLSGAFS